MKSQTAPTEFYTQWMEGQTALLKTWSDAATQAATAFAEGNLSEAMKKSTEGYSTIAQHQQEQAKNLFSEVANLGKTMSTANPFAQMWAAASGVGANGVGANEAASTNHGNGQIPFADPAAMMQYWANFQKMMPNPFSAMMWQPPQDIFAQWNRFAEAGTSSFALFGSITKMYEQWQQFSKSWGVSVQKMYSPFAETMPNGVAKDTFRNMLSGANVYMKLFEFWMPAFEMMKSGTTPTPEDVQNLLNPAKYKEVIDSVFEFMIPSATQDLYAQMNAFAQSLHVSGNQASRTMMGLMEQNAQMIFSMMANNPEAALKVYNTMMSSYQQALSSMNALPMNQRQSEIVEVARRILERFGEYTTGITKFQYVLYTSGQKAIEQVAEQFFSATRSRKALTNFDEVFAAWVATSENVFSELFDTQEYAALQNTLAQTSSLLHKDFEQLFEVMLKDFPVVTRSQVDELAKTVFELKRKVRDLEKQSTGSTGSEEEQASPSKPAAKKTSAQKR